MCVFPIPGGRQVPLQVQARLIAECQVIIPSKQVEDPSRGLTSPLPNQRFCSGTGAVLEEEKVCSLSHESLPFYDKVQIDPPVSSALVSTMRRIFSPSELDNIVHDVGDVDAGCVTYMINPCEPKV